MYGGVEVCLEVSKKYEPPHSLTHSLRSSLLPPKRTNTQAAAQFEVGFARNRAAEKRTNERMNAQTFVSFVRLFVLLVGWSCWLVVSFGWLCCVVWCGVELCWVVVD